MNFDWDNYWDDDFLSMDDTPEPTKLPSKAPTPLPPQGVIAGQLTLSGITAIEISDPAVKRDIEQGLADSIDGVDSTDVTITNVEQKVRARGLRKLQAGVEVEYEITASQAEL